MMEISLIKRKGIGVVSILFSVLLSSCALFKSPEPPPPPPVVAEKPKPKPAPVAKKPKAVPDVAVIISSDKPVYRDLGNLIVKKLKPQAKLFTLEPGIDQSGVLKKVSQKQYKQVVSVGISAAMAARTLKDKQVVFAKVFNYSGKQLLKPSMKGVSMIPPPRKVFKAWKQINPRLQKIGIVTGVGQGHLLNEIKEAAKEQGLTIVHKQVANNKEFVFASKGFDNSVSGQWILQDNRIISVSSLKEVMSHGVRVGRQMFGFSPDLLKYGALAHVEAIDEDIAKKVLAKLRISKGKNAIIGRNIAPLNKLSIEVSQEAADRLGLRLPVKYRQKVEE